MELRQIRYFLALSETLNFTRAAERCNVTQPTLTLAIKKLEEELGGSLIHRERNRTHLTQLGQMVLPFLEQVYESSDAARAIASDLSKGTRVPLSLGVSDAVDKSRLLTPIREVRTVADGLELHVEGGSDMDLIMRLLDGNLNLAIVDASVATEPRLRCHTLYTEEMVLVMPETDPLASERALSLDSILDRHWVGLVDSIVHEDFAMAAIAAHCDWSIRHRATRPTEAQVLVLSDLGLTLGGDHEPLLPGLTFCPLAEPLLTRTMVVAEVRGRQASSAAVTLTRLLRAQMYEPRARQVAESLEIAR